MLRLDGANFHGSLPLWQATSLPASLGPNSRISADGCQTKGLHTSGAMVLTSSASQQHFKVSHSRAPTAPWTTDTSASTLASDIATSGQTDILIVSFLPSQLVYSLRPVCLSSNLSLLAPLAFYCPLCFSVAGSPPSFSCCREHKASRGIAIMPSAQLSHQMMRFPEATLRIEWQDKVGVPQASSSSWLLQLQSEATVRLFIGLISEKHQVALLADDLSLEFRLSPCPVSTTGEQVAGGDKDDMQVPLLADEDQSSVLLNCTSRLVCNRLIFRCENQDIGMFQRLIITAIPSTPRYREPTAEKLGLIAKTNCAM
ncbi:unnamed protein product [Protopolystoma xenopodis]|uniref:Uncharacterized protein n=1 Tax=Protopolystoma xenopodis TaxID=117903 RepID=A0A448XGF6_9PLAT|nr:unnamed protein product [Protopolystoma xenopodis]